MEESKQSEIIKWLKNGFADAGRCLEKMKKQTKSDTEVQK